MYEQTTSITTMDNLYKTILLFYPKKYRQLFGQEMFYTFQDLYQAEISNNGKISFGFWFSIFTDTIKSVFRENLTMAKQQGFKKYLHINNYNILGIIFLLPFLSVFILEFIGRLVQGDLTHYNRAYYADLSHSFLYANYFGRPYLLILVLIILPLLAVVINIIPLVRSVFQNNKQASLKKFLSANSFAILILLTGLFFLLIVFGHDLIPCTISGLINGHGLFETVAYCRNV